MGYLAKHDDRLLFLPLGGSGEIGMNMNLYGHKGQWIMVDCGMTFADSYFPGVDLVFPDPIFIEREKNSLAALVVTHGHEDHIGAIPYLWRRFECPIYATAFTAELIKDKLSEVGLLEDVDLRVAAPGQRLTVGPFDVEYVPLAHSIAEGNGLAIYTSAGTLFHTGDWKLDTEPVIGPKCPSDRLKQLGDEGVLALIGDSTNVFNPTESGSESAVRDSLIDLCTDMTGRIVITTFASNVARLDSIGEVARRTGRHICLLGRSMQRIYKAAKATGYLTAFPEVLDEDDAAHIPRDKILILCTGCQGEARAALSRIARDDHRNLTLSEGDTVIFSSKIIPGNEIPLGQLFNALSENKITVITEKDHFVHVSGHPSRAELAEMYDWIKPKVAIPVHGEGRHLIEHAKLARSLGVPHALAPKNGDIIEIKADGARVVDEAPVGRLILDGDHVIEAGSPVLGDRRRASQQGFVTISMVLANDGYVAAEPQLAILGLPSKNADMLYDTLLDAAEQAVEKLPRKKRLNDDHVQETVRIAVRRTCRSLTGKNPGVATMLVREDEIEFR